MFYAPADVHPGGDTLVQPDIVVIRQDPDNPPADSADMRVPELVVEILSPATADRDRWKTRAAERSERSGRPPGV